MKAFFRSLTTSVICLFILTIILGVVYPAVIYGIGQLFFKARAEGSLVYSQNNVVGSDLIAQSFTQPKYFHPRASNAGDKGYDGANSSGSNLGPTSKKLAEVIKKRSEQYRLDNQLSQSTPLPADAITSSGSGLDPHISVANARLQAQRIALARGVEKSCVDHLIDKHTEGLFLGLFGQKRINVLRINLALDAITNPQKH